MPRTKPKTNRRERDGKAGGYDECYTPWYAFTAKVRKHIPTYWRVWESAYAADSMLAGDLETLGYQVYVTGIENGQDFFEFREYPADCKVQITNPPFSLKYKWLAHSLELGMPFALLMPADWFASAQGQDLWVRSEELGPSIEMIVLRQRVDCLMPRLAWEGAGSQFGWAWVTWKLGIGRQISFSAVGKPNRDGHYAYYGDRLKIDRRAILRQMVREANAAGKLDKAEALRQRLIKLKP